MQEQKQPKVTMIDSEKESNKTFNVNQIITEVIDGRTFLLEEPSALEYNDYINAAEGDEKKIFSLMQNSILTYIKSIDGVEFKKPSTQSEIRMGLTRLGKKHVIDRITKVLKETGLIASEQNTEESKEALKK